MTRIPTDNPRPRRGAALLSLPLLAVSCSGDGIRKAGADDRLTVSSSVTATNADAAVATMAVATAPAAVAAPAACPTGMTLVEGEYCTDVEHKCKKWLDPSGRYHLFRCAAYEQPAKCKGGKVSMRYCIDVDEQKLDPARVTDDKRPDNRVSFITTSNFKPDDLYPNGLNRERIVPAIELLNDRLQVINVDAGTDYRRRTLTDAKLYHTPLDPAADAETLINSSAPFSAWTRETSGNPMS